MSLYESEPFCWEKSNFVNCLIYACEIKVSDTCIVVLPPLSAGGTSINIMHGFHNDNKKYIYIYHISY